MRERGEMQLSRGIRENFGKMSPEADNAGPHIPCWRFTFFP